MKIYEIREMPTEEIQKRIVEEELNLVDMRFQHELKQLTNTGKLKEVRHDIAKMKTVLQQRKLEEQNTAKENK